MFCKTIYTFTQTKHMKSTNEALSIKLLLDFADENGKRCQKEQTVKINPPKRTEHNSVSIYHIPAIYDITYNIKIPEFIYDYLIGKSVPRKDFTRDYTKDTKKSLSGNSLQGLCKAWSELISDYVWLKQMEIVELTKVIYYKFNHVKKSFVSHWNSAHFGDFAQIGFTYCIGYVKKEGNKEVRYTHEKKSVSYSSDRDFYELKYVEWSEEREEFFNNIKKGFSEMVDKISSFDSNIEKLIENVKSLPSIF